MCSSKHCSQIEGYPSLAEYIHIIIEAINMQVDTLLILRLEKLSNLQLEATERERFAGDLDKIVGMINQLQQADTSGVEPLAYLSDRTAAFRQDEINHQLSTSDGLKNAPAQDGKFFRAPKVTSKPD